MNIEKMQFIYYELLEIHKVILERRTVVELCKPHLHSCMNMQDFLSLKKFDLTMLQKALVDIGFSSLEWSHFYLIYTIEKQLEALAHLLGYPPMEISHEPSPEDVYASMQRRSSFLKSSQGSSNSVMITLPSEAAEIPALIQNLATRNIDIVRINTAHDSLPQWQSMAKIVQEINQSSRQNNPLKIYVDLAGPKIRTGKIKLVTQPLKIRSDGHSMLLLTTKKLQDISLPHDICGQCIVEEHWFKKRRKGERVLLTHPELKNRKLRINKIDEKGLWLTFDKKLIFDDESQFEIQDKKKDQTPIIDLPQIEQVIRLYVGNLLWLRSDISIMGHLCEDNTIAKAEIACSNTDIFNFIEIETPLYIDDGKIGLRVIEKTDLGVLCRVEHAKPNGVILKGEKGINFPETNLDIDAVTSLDKQNLQAVIEFADIIGISFTQKAAHVAEVKAILKEKNKEMIGLVAKIETKKGLQRLPFILMELFSWQNSGVMIARGDLAIEVGFENLPKIQEEILELCEAAHTPVIYATQILENMMKKNLPSRAEVVDASMAQRADCIMLNKGLFAVETIEMLGKILDSVRPMFFKSRHLLPIIKEWSGYLDAIHKYKRK